MIMTTPSHATVHLQARAFVDSFNHMYASRHYLFEEQFWGTKMALKGDFTAENLASTKKQLEDFLSDDHTVEQAKQYRASLGENSDVTKILDVIIRTCKTLPPTAKVIRETTNELESQLEMMRNNMKLGYFDKTNDQFKEMSSVGLRNLMRTAKDESVRKAAYEGLRSVGPFVCANGFVEIVKKRNQLARELGFEDYYDYTVTQAEGFDKKTLFNILDTLEQGTRPLMVKARNELASRHGASALDPWNTSFCMAGSVVAKMDPYFPFAKAVERYLRSYAALNISYRGGTLNLDLLDRSKKYSNGFCHWPVPAWIKSDGTWQPAVANFTSLADPTAVGSGLTALTTLMHEAGHAAHFANIEQPSPLFSQERAPTSVAYAENQSMLLDSLVGDAAWRAIYARDVNGNPIPFDVIEEEIRATHPFAVFQLRGMLAVSYFEKALYELPDDQLTSESIQVLADEIERDIEGGFSPRPLLSIPHLISDEASCYYQGYTLAEMSVHQTRDFLLKKYGYIVNNPNVGPTLRDAYWKCGNSKNFLEIVKDLTGHELTGDAWTAALQETVEDKVARQRKEYDDALVKGECQEFSEQSLDMIVRFVDGDTLIADSTDVGILGACKGFEDFVLARIQAASLN